MYLVPEPILTNRIKFSAYLGAGKLPDPNISVPMPINHPSKPGGSAVVGARHP
jgi:hypothetical protein